MKFMLVKNNETLKGLDHTGTMFMPKQQTTTKVGKQKLVDMVI
jgi:hypothetical protein